MKKYKQVSMMRAIGDQVSVMNKLLNDALRAKGYKGPDIKMVLTDVTDPNGPYYIDTLTNTVVFDRKKFQMEVKNLEI